MCAKRRVGRRLNWPTTSGRRTYVSELEHGKRNVSLLTMEIIARGFKLSVSQLLRGL
jgi:transcriptional regulator with XRE-family HTH domain